MAVADRLGTSKDWEEELEELLDHLEQEDEATASHSSAALGTQHAACPGPTAVTVSGFSRYQHSVQSLPAGERARIGQIAQLISASAKPGCQFLGMVRLIGHADQDLQRGPVFEAKISAERAAQVQVALVRAIRNPVIVSRIQWEITGTGASQRVVPVPRTEAQRAQNRRVEIVLAPSGAPVPDVHDPRINVYARQALMRMLRGHRRAQADAIGMISAIKHGQLAGIYKEDDRAVTLFARTLKTDSRRLIPPNEGAALIIDPLSATTPPLIDFRDRIRSIAKQLDPALRKSWRTYLLWRGGQLNLCPIVTRGTTRASAFAYRPVANLTPPNLLCQPGDGRSLRDFLRQSQQVTGDPNALWQKRKLPKISRGDQATKTGEGPWDYALEFVEMEGPQATSLTVFNPDMKHEMAVLDSLRWHDVSVSAPDVRGGAPIHLSLTAGWVLGFSHSGSGHISANSSHPFWRLESDLAASTLVALGYQLEDNGSLTPIPEEVIDADNFEAVFDSGKVPGSAAGKSRRWILVCLELVTCKPRADFEPFGVLDAARIYPLIEVLCNFKATEVRGSITMIRPAISCMTEGMADGGKIAPALFTDRNVDEGISVPLAVAALPMAGLLKTPPLPLWNSIFDYYVIDATGAGVFTGVNPGAKGRTDDKHRRSLSLGPFGYSNTLVRKVARQGAFDNLHLAPRMAFTRPKNVIVPVTMAPVCLHDCFHVHWRWGEPLDSPQSRGWDTSGPYAVAGAPLVPVNQTVQVAITPKAPGFTYTGAAANPQRLKWTILMHHGAAYAIRIGNAALNAAAGAFPQGWAGIYHLLRFEDVQLQGNFYERVDADVTPLAAL